MTATVAASKNEGAEMLAPELPKGRLPENFDANLVAQSYVDKLNTLSAEDLHEDVSWRDLLAFTNNIRTFNQRSHVIAAWQTLFQKRSPTNFKLIAGSAKGLQLGPSALLTARFSFETTSDLIARSTGTVILLPGDSEAEWKFWILNTLLEEADILGNPDKLDIVTQPSTNFVSTNGETASGAQRETVDVVVVGAGQNGLCMLGRLKALGLKAVALEKYAEIGDNWTHRYDSAKLHLSKWYANMPFGNTFNDESYPYFLGAADLARGFRKYVKDYALDIRTSTNVDSATWDAAQNMWTVGADHNGSRYTINGRHLIFAVGADQVPNFPQYPGRDLFKGVVVHSVDYKSPKPWKGLRGVVVGTANTAHDVAEDMVEEGLSSITMVQRSPTIVLPWPFIAHNHDREYNSDANLYESDQNQWALPLRVYDTLPRLAYAKYTTQHPEMFQALEKRGFKVKIPKNFMGEIRARSGGHYLDVGCCQKIIDGEITVKGGEIECYTPTGLRFTDGTSLDADVIVWATGFQSNVRKTATKIVGPEIGAQLEDYPKWDQEGEIPGFFRRQKHPNIWYATGELAMARLYSRFLAMFIKADLSGVPFEPYLETP
ncbi:hypothetical protein ACN47E_002487 [Coniothyrium glycines]